MREHTARILVRLEELYLGKEAVEALVLEQAVDDWVELENYYIRPTQKPSVSKVVSIIPDFVQDVDRDCEVPGIYLQVTIAVQE